MTEPSAPERSDPLERSDGRYHHGDLKPALKQAARERLSSHGSSAISLREIARTLGVSHAAVYRHYTDREELLADLAADGFATLARAQREAIVAAGPSPVEQLKACGRAYVRFGIDQPHLLQLMFGPEIERATTYGPLAEGGCELAAILSDLIGQGQASGDLRGGDSRDLALAAWSIVHGLTLLLVGQRIPGATVDMVFAKRAARHCTDLLVEGLASASASAAAAAAAAAAVAPPSRIAPAAPLAPIPDARRN